MPAHISASYHHVSSYARQAKNAVEGKYSDIKQSSVGSKVHSFAATLKKVANVPINFVKSHPKIIAGVGIATTAIGGLTANPAAIGIGIALISVGTLGYMSSRHAETKALNQTTLEMLQNPNKVLEMKHQSAVLDVKKAEDKLEQAEKALKKASADADKASPNAKGKAIVKAGEKADLCLLANYSVAEARVLEATANVELCKGKLSTLEEQSHALENNGFDETENLSQLQEKIELAKQHVSSASEALTRATEALSLLKSVPKSQAPALTDPMP